MNRLAASVGYLVLAGLLFEVVRVRVFGGR